MPADASIYPPPTCDQTADVVIFGASVAGIAAATALISGGIPAQRIILLETGALDWASSGCSRGVMSPGFWHLYNRLCTSMGADAQRLFQFTAINALRMSELGHFSPSTCLYLPATEFEEQEMRESVAALPVDIEILTPKQAAEQVGFEPPFAVGVDPLGGGFDPVKLTVDGLAHLAAMGVRIHCQIPVPRMHSPSDGTIQIELAQTNSKQADVILRCECLINASESQAIAASPSLATMVMEKPHRLTWLKSPQPVPSHAAIWNRDQCSWHKLDDSTVLLTETRPFADFDAEQHPLFQHQSFSISQTTKITSLASADGLPLIGPNPSRSDELLCLGFQGWSSNFAAMAGFTAAELLLNGRSEYPDLFSPRRLL